MTFKPEDYIHHLDAYDLTAEEKTAFIEALWIIARSFADQAFGVALVKDSGAGEPRNSLANLIKSNADQNTCAKAANDNAAKPNKRGAA